ncbi:hypothetical protein [Phenylobacterium sp. 58.2.17]|uniref:hypothetical protein n=1 Tax=Phenylobacterium sp. 58.2.17 TaxID=2969306 RepID=UPI002263D8ED|nr:hypothetical protein [Phenylobacterium sp. 58.2.17]MCX7586540.1 hypothetical protein [Phenylobacterium sp. 58.2.17]
MDRQLLLAKVEAAYPAAGDAPQALVAANAIWAEDVQYKGSGQRERSNPAKPGAGIVAEQTYGEHSTLTFKVPLAGSGTPGEAPAWGELMAACAWAETIDATVGLESVTYKPMPNQALAKSVTFKWRDAERAHVIIGARGKVGLELSPGQRPMLVFSFKGMHLDPTASAELVHADAVWAAWLDAKTVANGTSTMSFAGIANLRLREFSFDQDDNVRFIDAPGVELVTIAGDRVLTGQMKVGTPPLGTLNLEGKWKSGDVSVFSVTHGTVPGNIVTINGRVQVSDAPTYGREDGMDTASNPILAVNSGLDKDDDLAIVIT